jgi:hypothetical protein
MAGDRTFPDLDYFSALAPSSLAWPSSTPLSALKQDRIADPAAANVHELPGPVHDLCFQPTRQRRPVSQLYLDSSGIVGLLLVFGVLAVPVSFATSSP